MSRPKVERISKTLRVWRKEAIRQGWTVTLAKNGHVAFQPPTGGVVQIAATPSDYRTRLNDRARLRRAGLILE